jgi:3-hydroxy-9,10-secoandrosta-1,3,5(10)-triene-9,17-dione monooxygenase
MTDQIAPASAEEMLERVRAIAPFVAEHAAQAERERKPVDEVMAALEATGVFKSYVPRRFGGYEIDTDTFIDVGLAVSEACTSTGWVTTFYMEHNWILSQFPPETLEEIFGSQPYVLAPGSISPTGKAHAVDGGYRLSGRWGWGTGIMHADWVLLSGIIDGSPPQVKMFIVPRDEVRVIDTWDCSGMEGTGSNDMAVEDLFVCEARSESLEGMAVGRGSGGVWLDSPCYRHPMMPLLAIAAAIPTVGCARRAVDLFKERLSTRTLYGTRGKQIDKAASQIRLGHAATEVRSAETLLREAGRNLMTWSDTDQICPPEERARLRLSVAHVVRMCRDVVRNLMEVSGASAQMRSHPMQRIHRDIHTMSGHTVFDLDVGGENYGRLILGLDPTSPV